MLWREILGLQSRLGQTGFSKVHTPVWWGCFTSFFFHFQSRISSRIRALVNNFAPCNWWNAHPQCSACCSCAHIWVTVQSFSESWIGATSDYLPKSLCGFCSLCWLLCCCKVCCGQLRYPWSYFFMDRKSSYAFHVENHYSAPLNATFWSGRRIWSHNCERDWCVKKCDEPVFCGTRMSCASREEAAGIFLLCWWDYREKSMERCLLCAAVTEGTVNRSVKHQEDDVLKGEAEGIFIPCGVLAVSSERLVQENQSKPASKWWGSGSLKPLDLCLAVFGACWPLQDVVLFTDEANSGFFYFLQTFFLVTYCHGTKKWSFWRSVKGVVVAQRALQGGHDKMLIYCFLTNKYFILFLELQNRPCDVIEMDTF